MAHHKPVDKHAYNSNPFTLAFEALSRFFSTNSGWAIALIVLGMMAFFVQIGGNLVSAAFNSDSGNTYSSYNAAPSEPLNVSVIIAIMIVVFVFILAAIFIGTAIKAFLKGMFSYVALESEKGNSVSLNEAAGAGAKRFWRLYITQLLANLKIFGWLLLFIVPGIIAALRYSLLSYVVMDEPATEKGIMNAHQRVKQLTKGRLLEVYGVSTVAAIIPFIGQLVGLSGNAALYRQLQVYTDENLKKPNIHWLNYLGLILVGVVLIFVLFILGIVALVALSQR